MTMCRSKHNSKKNKSTRPFPIAPWIYISSTSYLPSASPTPVATSLTALIPKASPAIQALGVFHSRPDSLKPKYDYVKRKTDMVWLIVDENKDINSIAISAKECQRVSIEQGCNFASVNLSDGAALKGVWGTNHLDLDCQDLTAGAIAKKIFKWLFTVLTVPETLHLIPDASMLATNTKSYPDYVYCSLADNHRFSPSDKIQFVALIASKPEVGPDQKLHWRVVDKTGEATFYFQYRDSRSQPTWDWVMALKPGELRALPRMPMIQIKEKNSIRATKAPFRATAAIVSGTGAAIKCVGHGICWMGDKVRLGPKGGKWVAEADMKDGKVQKTVKADVSEKKTVQTFKANGEKCWDEEKWDDTASTAAGSVMDEKMTKEFC